MFIKRINKYTKASGERSHTYRLVESYRCGDTCRHLTILHLGTLAELPEATQKRALSLRIEQLVRQDRTKTLDLFTDPDPAVERLAHHFFAQIKEARQLDLKNGTDFRLLDADSIKNNDICEMGAEWLCLQALEQLQLPQLLQAKGWNEEDIQLALTHICARATYPASELRTSKWLTQNSAVCELTGYPKECITKDKLYRITNDLFAEKDAIEQHLSQRTNDLFDLQDKIIIYDLTNTYFEGSMRKSKIARYGRSKEKRSDAKLIVLAVVVNAEGFLKYSHIFEGNTADPASLPTIIGQLSGRTTAGQRRPIVVMDAGIATEDNLKLLRKEGYDYMCVSRSGLKNHTVDATAKPVEISDKKGQPMTLQRVQVQCKADTWLRVHSQAKALKEAGMSGAFAQRFEQGLEQIKASLAKKGGIKKRDKVWERIGRLKEKYPSIHKHYELEVSGVSAQTEIITTLRWQQKPKSTVEGYYLLRTTLNDEDEATQWVVYNTIREIEATFRVLKTDLDLRPIYHKTDSAAMAHLHLGLLAYWVVNTLRHQLKRKDNNNQWREIVRTMSSQKMVTTTIDEKYDGRVWVRQCSEPTAEVSAIYAALGYRAKPFNRRKSVVPYSETKKNETPQYQGVAPP